MFSSEINGQPRTIDIENREFSKNISQRAKAEDNNDNHVGSPLPGQVAKFLSRLEQLSKVINF